MKIAAKACSEAGSGATAKGMKARETMPCKANRSKKVKCMCVL